jgi:hypothetical protein
MFHWIQQLLRSRLLRGLLDQLKHVKHPEKVFDEKEKFLYILLVDYLEKKGLYLTRDIFASEVDVSFVDAEEHLHILERYLPRLSISKELSGERRIGIDVENNTYA